MVRDGYARTIKHDQRRPGIAVRVIISPRSPRRSLSPVLRKKSIQR